MTSQITYEMSGVKKLKVIACVDDRNGMLFLITEDRAEIRL